MTRGEGCAGLPLRSGRSSQLPKHIRSKLAGGALAPGCWFYASLGDFGWPLTTALPPTYPIPLPAVLCLSLGSRCRYSVTVPLSIHEFISQSREDSNCPLFIAILSIRPSCSCTKHQCFHHDSNLHVVKIMQTLPHGLRSASLSTHTDWIPLPTIADSSQAELSNHARRWVCLTQNRQLILLLANQGVSF